MKLCVGATSRRMVEVAAAAHVHQIVASRRQVAVNAADSYTGVTCDELVGIVKSLGSRTQVVRDHGGPLQSGFSDDGIADLDHCTRAGFHGLHLDVCKLPRSEQIEALRHLVLRYAGRIPYEIGGEHDEFAWNDVLQHSVFGWNVRKPTYAVVSIGTFVWSDRQHGTKVDAKLLRRSMVKELHAWGVEAKGHNADWIGDRKTYFADALDAYNVAPEFGALEVDALLTVLSWEAADKLLHYAYESKAWERWFGTEEGTWLERAKCAVRYLQADPYVVELTQLDDRREQFIRTTLRNAIQRG